MKGATTSRREKQSEGKPEQAGRTQACPLPAAGTIHEGKAPKSLRTLDPNWDEEKTGPKARAFKQRIESSCAGWGRKPTSEALHEEHPNTYQQALISMWVNEATEAEIMDGWIQEAYTLRELVEAMHRTGNTWNTSRNRWIRNWLSETA